MSDPREYPPEWPAVSLRTKHEVGWRCVRCRHPGAVAVPRERYEKLMRGEVGAQTVTVMVSEQWASATGERRVPLSLPLAEYLHRARRTEFEEVQGVYWIRDGALACAADCSHPREPWKQRVLTVHHLDGQKENLRWWNLAALCQADHLTIQGKVKMDQAYQLPHSPWFLPYVAGFYAERLAGLVLTRAEVEADLCELLILGQPHLEDHYRETIPSG